MRASNYIIEALESALALISLDFQHLQINISFKRGRAAVPRTRFYFNRLTHKCLPFQYHGCGWNGNNFESYKACVNRCDIKNTIKQERVSLKLENKMVKVPLWLHFYVHGVRNASQATKNILKRYELNV